MKKLLVYPSYIVNKQKTQSIVYLDFFLMKRIFDSIFLNSYIPLFNLQVCLDLIVFMEYNEDENSIEQELFFILENQNSKIEKINTNLIIYLLHIFKQDLKNYLKNFISYDLHSKKFSWFSLNHVFVIVYMNE